MSKSLLLVGRPLAIALALAFLVRTTLQIFAIPSASMEPTLRVGDHIVVTPYYRGEPGRGDVVVFRSPQDPNLLMVKRVIALEGDLIESRAGRVLIGGHAVAEPYLRSPVESGAIAAQIIPHGCYFVMGDNRGNSYDSRNWGVLPASLVVGHARMVLWSSGDGSSQPSAGASEVSRSGEARQGERVGRIFRLIE